MQRSNARARAVAIGMALAIVACATSPPVVAVCVGPLLFDLDGPTCSPARTWLQCACSEGFRWDATPRTEWYEIQRTDQARGTIVRVGFTSHTHWWFPHDNPLPTPGRLYEYQVRACRANPIATGNGMDVQCSASWSAKVRYVASPMECIDPTGATRPCWDDNWIDGERH